MVSRADGPGPGPGDPAPGDEFDAEELREAEHLLSGTGSGGDGGITIPWPMLFRHRMHHRVARSDRYQWWVLWTVLAGLLSVNITFTVFVVALPQVARQLHTTVTTLTWTSTGPPARCWRSGARAPTSSGTTGSRRWCARRPTP